MIKTLNILAVLLLFCGESVRGQVPGDGIPDVYYFPIRGIANTSEGIITRPAGTLTVDTDGADMAALLVSGPDLSPVLNPDPNHPDGPCPADGLCDGGALYDPHVPVLEASFWTVVYVNGLTQWIRNSPLSGPGYQGIVGGPEPNGDPFDVFPEYGMGNYGPGLTDADFPQASFGPDGQGSFLFATGAGQAYVGDVTFAAPEPTGIWLFMLSGLVAAPLCRRP